MHESKENICFPCIPFGIRAHYIHLEIYVVTNHAAVTEYARSVSYFQKYIRLEIWIQISTSVSML
jgi:hypothetical protein